MAAKTWGPALLRALAVYKAAVKSVICYTALIIASLCGIVDRQRAIERSLAREQNDYLQRLAGACTSTSVEPWRR